MPEITNSTGIVMTVSDDYLNAEFPVELRDEYLLFPCDEDVYSGNHIPAHTDDLRLSAVVDQVITALVGALNTATDGRLDPRDRVSVVRHAHRAWVDADLYANTQVKEWLKSREDADSLFTVVSLERHFMNVIFNAVVHLWWDAEGYRRGLTWSLENPRSSVREMYCTDLGLEVD